MSVLKNRYDFVLFFDVTNGNPNGDPDAGDLPRMDPETGFGLVTDVCIKRKVRNYISLLKSDKAPHCIYIREGSILQENRKPAYEDTKDADTKDKVALGRSFMCKNFFDVRSFGAVMSTKEHNCGQVRGPVQFTFARSLDPINPMELTITRMAVESQVEADKQKGSQNQTMGRKNIVPYALYRMEGFISAPLAEQTGFTEDDLELLWEALSNMFEHDRSASKGLMSSRKLYLFKHENRMGNAPAHALFDEVQAELKDNPVPREYSDYKIWVNTENIPQNVELIEYL